MWIKVEMAFVVVGRGTRGLVADADGVVVIFLSNKYNCISETFRKKRV